MCYQMFAGERADKLKTQEKGNQKQYVEHMVKVLWTPVSGQGGGGVPWYPNAEKYFPEWSFVLKCAPLIK